MRWIWQLDSKFLSTRLATFCVLLASATLVQASVRQLPHWPTPNSAFVEGKALSAYIQPTTSGLIKSGLFGCVRNGGARFHEGIDLYPIARDAAGEARDSIFCVLPGRVVHVSTIAGHSSYGRYVVVEHQQASLQFYSLYAHLARVAPGVKVGLNVAAGSILGVMGRSAAGYRIPKSYAHLHFELVLKLSDQFQTWYDRQKFGSSNRHGIWNGMNLVGVDPLEFFQQCYRGSLHDFKSYLEHKKVAARIRVITPQIPDFVRNHPALVTAPYQGRKLFAWDIGFSQYGVPLVWTPRFESCELIGRKGDVSVIAYSASTVGVQSCRQVVKSKGKKVQISKETYRTLQLLFAVAERR
jgi:murein DD-endopeptidase MepM/ murein hydrolase activator NlpD